MQDEGAGEQDVLGVPASDRTLHSDPHDFAGLYIRHRASFTLHARRYLRDARDADEVVQEAFLRLFLALPELETELQALAYCRRTITNLCIDRFRAQARRPSLVDLESAGAMDLAEDDPGDPVVRAEDAAMVRTALSLLSPLHRAALVKREIEEKPLPVIAEELDIAEESVKHVLFRARRALRRILAGTSLAPGSDAEIAGALAKAARAGSGGLAAFFLLLVLGLGTGPDLRAIPVVGADLPEIIPVTDLAQAVGDVVTGVAGAVSSAGGDEQPTDAAAAREDAGDPLPAADPTRSPAPAPAPAPGPQQVGEPQAGSVVESPSGSSAPAPETASAASPQETTASGEPTSSASPTASASPSPTATSSPEASSEPTSSTSPSPSTSPKPRKGGPNRHTESRPSSSPSPSSTPTETPEG